MKLECRQYGRSASGTTCSEVERELNTLRKMLSAVLIGEDSETSPSETIKRPFKAWANLNGWKFNQLIDGTWESALSVANYKILGIKDLPNSECGHRHRIYFHTFFDNRQVIGTNLLRLQVALEYFEASENSLGHAVALIPDSNARSKFGWDNSVGTNEEYVAAILGPYKSHLTKTLDFWAIRAS